MTGSGSAELEYAREEIAAANGLHCLGFPSQAVSRSYYAAFYAAEGALLALGQSRSRHGGVIAAFGQFVVQAGGLDGRHGRSLRNLFEQRNRADYSHDPISAESARAAIDQAAAVVDAVAQWVESHGGSTPTKVVSLYSGPGPNRG